MTCKLIVESDELGLPSRNISRSLKQVEIGEAMSILEFRAESGLMDAWGASCYSETSGTRKQVTHNTSSFQQDGSVIILRRSGVQTERSFIVCFDRP